MLTLDLLIKKEKEGEKIILRGVLTLLWVVMSEDKVIILLNSCSVGGKAADI